MVMGFAGLNCAEIISPVARYIGINNPGKLASERMVMPCGPRSSLSRASMVR